jgi:hypothetical protein
MRYLKYFVLLAALALPVASSHAQVSIGVRVGHPVHRYYYERACPYGYYPTAYGCAAYGYYRVHPRYHYYRYWDRDDRYRRGWRRDHDRW